MPKPGDILTEEDDEDPEDQLRMQLEQGQGNNLAGAPQPQGQTGLPSGAAPPPQGGPSPNVPGPLAALAKKTPTLKPHIKLKSTLPMKKGKPKIKLKSAPSSSNPSSALQGFLNAIGTNPGS